MNILCRIGLHKYVWRKVLPKNVYSDRRVAPNIHSVQRVYANGNTPSEALVQLSIHRPSNIYMTAKQFEKAKAHVKKKSGVKDDFDLSFSGIDIRVI